MRYFTALLSLPYPTFMTNTASLLPEWAPQASVLLAWPHKNTDWQPWLDAIEQDYIELAAAIATAVPPLILCQDETHQQHIETHLSGRTIHPPRFVIAPYNDTWCRDYGPLTLGLALEQDQQRQLMDFRFNGWGDKYDARMDDQIISQLKSVWQAPITRLEFELEGGSIETDGQGALLTTRHCLLDSNRNIELTQAMVESRLCSALGVDRIIWLSKGALIGDDTDSHVDNLARFCGPGLIAYATCEDENDPHFHPLKEMINGDKPIQP